MVGGKFFGTVVQHKTQEQGIARTPDAPVTIDKSFNAFLYDLAGDIERA